MVELLKRLKPNEQRGSKPRCHWLTHGTGPEVADRLTELAAPWATVTAEDRWMPEGFEVLKEAQLHEAPRLLSPEISTMLGNWWLPAGRTKARTPNFDIASTCTIAGRRGLMLVEAKAHDQELMKEAAGRKLIEATSEDGETTRLQSDRSREADDRKASHITIGCAIEESRAALNTATALDWHISRDTHYQMSNRFAWSWKLAAQGIPVLLVYLGFLNADEMADRGKPFANPNSWEELVRAHSEPLFPGQVWDHRWQINGVSFVPTIRSVEQALKPES